MRETTELLSPLGFALSAVVGRPFGLGGVHRWLGEVQVVCHANRQGRLVTAHVTATSNLYSYVAVAAVQRPARQLAMFSCHRLSSEWTSTAVSAKANESRESTSCHEVANSIRLYTKPLSSMTSITEYMFSL